VKHCRFENIGMGVYTNYSGSSNFYIADKWFIGRNDPDHVIAWNGPDFWSQFATPDSGQVFPPKMLSYIAVKVYGPGHVIAYNYVANFTMGSILNPTAIRRIFRGRWPEIELWRQAARYRTLAHECKRDPERIGNRAWSTVLCAIKCPLAVVQCALYLFR
jgi:hypothetical protein